ncbi:MAG: winged helix-turn-helix domain-containing protein [Burkholderiales bacterium]|nr:winged helix-turn-helix domain-containing protein [Burkholderiales bacterium]
MQGAISSPALAGLRKAASQCSAMLKAMSHEDRLLLLCQLTEGEFNVGELEERVGLRQPSLSQHLGVLRAEGLIAARRNGKYMYYSLASEEVVSIMETLAMLYCGRPKRQPR